MKFLTIASMKDTASTIPPSVARPLMEATFAVITQHKKEGKFLEYYFIPGWNRNVVISEAKSGEEIIQRISSLPIAGLMDVEVYPLADPFEAMKIYIESLKAAEKMFPPHPHK